MGAPLLQAASLRNQLLPQYPESTNKPKALRSLAWDPLPPSTCGPGARFKPSPSPSQLLAAALPGTVSCGFSKMSLLGLFAAALIGFRCSPRRQ